MGAEGDMLTSRWGNSGGVDCECDLGFFCSGCFGRVGGQLRGGVFSSPRLYQGTYLQTSGNISGWSNKDPSEQLLLICS